MDSFIKSVKKLIKPYNYDFECNCDFECSAKHFKQNFKNWTSGNDHIDKFIQNTQQSEHTAFVKKALEWIPYDRLYNIKYIIEDDEFGKMYRANWIDGFIYMWNRNNQNWERGGQNMFVFLKILNNPASVTLELINKLSAHTTNYEVKNVLEWISYDRLYDIKYISEDDEFGKVYRANWVDGCINIYYGDSIWNYENQDWERVGQNMFVFLKILNNPTSITLEFINKIAVSQVSHEVYGITKDPEIKDFMVVLKKVYNSIHFQCNFKNWTSDNNDIDMFIQNTQLSERTYYEVKNALEWISYDRLYDIKYIAEDDELGELYRANWIDGFIYIGNYDIDKFIQDTQLSVHTYHEANNALEWIPYDRLYDIEYILEDEEFGKLYRANWIDGFIYIWDDYIQNWERKNQNMFVILKIVNNPANITSEFINKIAVPHVAFGITQDPETKYYIGVLNYTYKKYAYNTMYFQRNFKNWTS
ncbi:hypothetical protein RhiirA1_473335, partial [Rhizophagus irregularis]